MALRYRCRFDTPIEATLAGLPVHLHELGLEGGILEHELAVAPGKRSWLTFRAGGDLYRLATDVVGCRVHRDRSVREGRLHFASEIRFHEIPPETAARLRQLIDVMSIETLDETPARHTEALQFEIVGV